MAGLRVLLAQGAARVVADVPAPDRRPACSCSSGSARRCSRGSCRRSSRRPAATSFGDLQLPTPTAATRSTSSGRTSPSSGRSPRSSWRWAPSPGRQDRGTAAFVLSKTASRGGFLGAKVVAIAAVLGIGTRPGRGGRLDLHGDPVRAAERPGLDRAGRRWPGLGSWPGRRSRSSAAPSPAPRPRPRASGSWPCSSFRSCRRSRASRHTRQAGSRVRPWRWRRVHRSRSATSCCPVALDGGPDRGRARCRRLVVPPPGALAPGQTTPSRRRAAICAGVRPQRREDRRRCPGRAAAAASGSSRASRDSRNGIPTCRMTPQAGCSCSTVIPRAAASGDANASTMSRIGAARDLGRLERGEPGRAGRARGSARRATGRSTARCSTRSPFDGEARVRGQVRQPERLAEAPPLALGADGDRDRRRLPSRTSRTGRCSGARCRDGRARRPSRRRSAPG